MRFHVSLAMLALVGCPAPTPTDGDPDLCQPLDVDGLANGGTVPAGCWELGEDWSVTADVVLEAGANVVVEPGVGIHVRSSGSLKTLGTPGQPVVFEGAQANAGSWLGVHFDEASSVENTWRHTEVHHACSGPWTGASDSFGAVFAEGNSFLDLTGLTIVDCPETALQTLNPEVELHVDGLTTRGATLGARITAEQAAGLSGALDFDGTDATVHLRHADIDTPTTLPGYAYTVEVRMRTTSDLAIEPGATLLFAQDLGLSVEGGTLSAVGTSEAPILLTGVEDLPGFWKGVHYTDSDAAANALTHVVIRGAGSSRWLGTARTLAGLYLEGSQVRLTVRDTRIEDASGPGISIDGPDPEGRIDIASTTISGCTEGALVTPEAVEALAEDVTITGNTADHIRIDTSVPGADSIDRPASWIGREVPYRVDGTVFVYGSLDIGAGATLVFSDDAGLSAGSWPTPGGLLTIGELGAEEVLLTGEAATAGSWKGVALQGTLADNRIVNTRIEYAGSSPWNGAAASQAAVFVYSDSRLWIEQVTFADNAHADLYAMDTSVVSGCSDVTGTLEGGPDASVCL